MISRKSIASSAYDYEQATIKTAFPALEKYTQTNQPKGSFLI